MSGRACPSMEVGSLASIAMLRLDSGAVLAIEELNCVTRQLECVARCLYRVGTAIFGD